MAEGQGRKSSKETKKLKGTLKESREKEHLALPSVATIMAPAKFVNDYAKKEWSRVTRLLASYNALIPVDAPLLLAYCNEMGMYFECSDILEQTEDFEIKTTSTLKKVMPHVKMKNECLKNAISLANMFGFNPLARTKLIIDKPKVKIDPLEGL